MVPFPYERASLTLTMKTKLLENNQRLKQALDSNVEVILFSKISCKHEASLLKLQGSQKCKLLYLV